MHAVAMRPRKRFGQNFLIDDGVVDKIVACIAVRNSDRVLEVGPGNGVLTDALVAKAGRFKAVEIDRDLVVLLKARFGGIDIVQQDILRTELGGCFDGERFRVVGNLPFNIATELLARLFPLRQEIVDMHFMLQAEVVDRLTALPGSKAWGRLSVMAQYHCRIEKLFSVDRESFSPAPKVTSAFAKLVPVVPANGVVSMDRFREVTRVAFSARRKKLENAVKSLELDWSQLPIDVGARPEDIDVAGYVAMANQLAGKP
ncbi:MAG: 16S rRNA (adenine(1518)-N(6)/adenine(1519)-N(6))-dimethyltransferase RsmA [Gammaproteobacteria bacterium]|nr:16S rRNA (adenine(1518)-N(6)/adenine(1519)-N(6))-dimethyltransferase RsmA [Gammaproteobacteria bacterium]